MSDTGIKPLQLSIGDLLREPHTRYRIPMYQRRYAWGQTEVEQLLHDLLNCLTDRSQQADSTASPYYIGSLVVFKHSSTLSDVTTYEVIDGQQRLTTLMLLAACLRLNGVSANTLEFDNRPKSQAALKALFARQDAQDAPPPEDDQESSARLIGNYALIENFFKRDENKREELTSFLKENVYIMRVEVPPHTDVAHYFEIMNNRGEQLEMHEIVKARLLSALIAEPESRACLNQVWEACANMNQYIHFGFPQEKQATLFGQSYEDFLPANHDDLIQRLGDSSAPVGNGGTLREIITACQSGYSLKDKAAEDKAAEDKPDRFQSIVNFPNFLLLALGIHAGQGNIRESTLDDKKLIASFEALLLSEPDSRTKALRIKEFTYSLLRCRFLLDQYVIKRTLDDDENLRLKHLVKGEEVAKEKDVFAAPDNRTVQLLQAAFHVSHPRQAFKYWLLGTLAWLNRQPSPKAISGGAFLSQLESLAAAFMRDRYLTTDSKDKTTYLDIIFRNSGNATHALNQDIASRLNYATIDNIFVFNYLDYLLWQENRQQATPVSKINDFRFKLRGSIEHHYPQNPRNGHSKEWLARDTKNPSDDIHAFGNLCLLSHEKNSRLSDLLPHAKEGYYRVQHELDSIKQYWMMLATADQSGGWNPGTMQAHQNHMIRVLRAKLG